MTIDERIEPFDLSLFGWSDFSRIHSIEFEILHSSFGAGDVSIMRVGLRMPVPEVVLALPPHGCLWGGRRGFDYPGLSTVFGWRISDGDQSWDSWDSGAGQQAGADSFFTDLLFSFERAGVAGGVDSDDGVLVDT